MTFSVPSPSSRPLLDFAGILSLLQPLDRYTYIYIYIYDLSAIGSAIGSPISHPRTGSSSQPPRSKPLRGLNRVIVALWCPKPLENKRNKDNRGRDSQPHPRPRLNSQPQGATKLNELKEIGP